MKIEWSLNGKSVTEYPEITASNMGKRSSFLTIESVSYVHAGNYTCSAKNAAGETSFTSQLLVNGYFLLSFTYILDSFFF